MSSNLLKINSLTFKLRELTLLKDVSLVFKPGVLYGILGPNGSGKSTFLKVLCGIWKANAGEVLWHGKPLFGHDRKTISKIISLVPQQASPLFDFSVMDMVAMGLYPHGTISASDELLREILEKVDAWHLRNRSMTKISHGERQRIYIARALMTHSPILLLDEPTANLDISHQLSVWRLLRFLSQEGKIVVVVSHDLAAVKKHCDQVAVFQSGTCIASGSFQETIQPKLLADVFALNSSDTPILD